MFKPVCTFKQV